MKTIYTYYKKILSSFESGVTRGFFGFATALTPVLFVLCFFGTFADAAEYFAPAKTAVIEAVQLDERTIAITLNQSESLLNAAEVEFFFNPSYIYVYDVVITDSLCEDRFIIAKEIDNVTGRIFYQCGTITPFAGTSTTLATVSIEPLRFGTSTLKFATSTTNVLAHDGYGSNVTKDRPDSLFVFQG